MPPPCKADASLPLVGQTRPPVGLVRLLLQLHGIHARRQPASTRLDTARCLTQKATTSSAIRPRLPHFLLSDLSPSPTGARFGMWSGHSLHPCHLVPHLHLLCFLKSFVVLAFMLISGYLGLREFGAVHDVCHTCRTWDGNGLGILRDVCI